MNGLSSGMKSKASKQTKKQQAAMKMLCFLPVCFVARFTLNSENGDSIFLLNTGKCLPYFMPSHPKG
jgi:hypothetical protein